MINNIYHVSNKEEEVLVNECLNFVFDFNKKASSIYGKKISALSPEQCKIVLKKLMNLVINNKTFLTELLKEVILYARFGYFIIDSFIDSRGRLYLNGYLFNVQNSFLSRAFIKPFVPSLNQVTSETFEPIKKTFMKVIKNKEISNRLQRMTFKEYQETDKELLIQYLMKFLSNTSREDFLKLLSLDMCDKSLLMYIQKNIVKNKLVFVVYSYILQFKYPQSNLDFYVELDATANGLQMTGILFHSDSLATFSNLSGITNEDVYLGGSLLFKEDVEALYEITYKIIAKIPFGVRYIDKPIVMTDDSFRQLGSFEERLNTFVNLNFRESYSIPKLIEALLNDFKDRYLKIQGELIKPNILPIEPFYKELIKYDTIKYLTKYLGESYHKLICLMQ